jgi:hypothetical protein
MARVDPRLGAAFTLGGAGLFLFAVVILTSLLGDNAADRTQATLMTINAGVGIAVAVAGRLRPGAVALALGLITLGQALVAMMMIARGIGDPAVVGTVATVLAVPIFGGAVMAFAVVVGDRRARAESGERD